MEITYLDDRVSVGGGREAAVTARKICGLVKFKDCGELPNGRRFPLRIKMAVCKSHVRLAVMHGSEAWCLN